MKCVQVLWLFIMYIIGTFASTHWMVTESGLIQPKVDTPFEMARPYDLLAFLNQDTRWDNIINLYYDLSKRQEAVDKLWNELETNTDIATQLTMDKNCVKAGPLNLLDWYTSFLEDGRSKNIAEKEFLLYNPYPGQETDVPDCKKISSLTFSMCAFEHLEGMIQRENLTANAELSLPGQISPIMDIDQFGHWIASILKQNSSSWLHYNMASLYWRARGNAPKAMECSRRAVHYAPREYKDIALLSMGTVFHHSKKTEDAITVLGAAVDHDPLFHISHFVLANAYAIQGDFNNSLKHFDQCLKINPEFDLAVKHKNGVLCHAALLQRMQSVQSLLNKLREELVEYSHREAHWLKSQAAFLRTMKHPEEFDYRNVENNCQKMSELTGLNIKDLKKGGDKNSLIQYFLDGSMFNEKLLGERGVHTVESAYSLQRLVKHIEKHANMVSDFVVQADQYNKLSDEKIMKEIGPMPTFSDVNRVKLSIEPKDLKAESRYTISDKKSPNNQIEDDSFEFEGGIVLYPPSMTISRNMEDFDKDPDWPPSRFCKENAQNFPKNLDTVFSVFLPFENKGIRLKSLLTDRIGVPANLEHELPWHPPTCPQDKEAVGFTQKKSQKQQMVSEVVQTDYLRQKLLEYVGNGNVDAVTHMQDAEIGQRIYAAIQMKLAPKWLLYTLSSLYWRVRGNNANALNCLLSASRTVQPRYRDIVLASLASVYLEMGYFDEALLAAEEAFRISLYEPAINFILAELNMLKKHRNTHMFHLKQVVRVEASFMGGLARNLLNAWACLLQQTEPPHTLDFTEGDICTHVEPRMSMVCEEDGINCHMTNIHCFSSRDRGESSTLVRMLELKGDDIQRSTPDSIDDSMFDQFVENMPSDRRDRQAHHQNFEAMKRTIDNAMRRCGSKECNTIQPEDLALKEEDCTYQHLQLSYWLHIISFRQLLSDDNLRLPTEIATMAPSNKKIPECRLYSDPSEDFFLERLSRIDTEGWEPVLSLMHQFAEIFNFFDYGALGMKLAKYIETRPRWWMGHVGAGWWCGAGGRGACARRCLSAAHALAPPHRAPHALRALAALLHMQSKTQDAKDVAYLAFYLSPKSKIEAFLVAVSHTYLGEYEQAIWMYRYALTFDEKFLPAKACLHATMCLMLFGENAKTKPKEN